MRSVATLVLAFTSAAALAAAPQQGGDLPALGTAAGPPDPTCDDPKRAAFGDTLRGGGGDDRIYGFDSARLFGDADNDVIVGGADADDIDGGEGADLMTGGAGADRFIYRSLEDSPSSARGAWQPFSGDTITDLFLADGDRIDLTNLPRTGPSAPAVFQWSDAGARPYSIWAQPSGADTFVSVDTSGDRKADLVIRLLSSKKLSTYLFCGVARPPAPANMAITRTAPPAPPPPRN